MKNDFSEWMVLNLNVFENCVDCIREIERHKYKRKSIYNNWNVCMTDDKFYEDELFDSSNSLRWKGVYLDESFLSKEANPKASKGIKKSQLQLVPTAIKIALAEAFEEGAEKYGPFNWRKIPVEIMTYLGAIERHLELYKNGEDIDPESGKPHLSGILASAGLLLDSWITGGLIDNRPKVSKEALDIIRTLINRDETV